MKFKKRDKEKDLTLYLRLILEAIEEGKEMNWFMYYSTHSTLRELKTFVKLPNRTKITKKFDMWEALIPFIKSNYMLDSNGNVVVRGDK